MALGNLKVLDSKAKKVTRTSLDTILITPDLLKTWKRPPFQRPLKVNSKVMALAEDIKTDGGVIPGVITLGVLNGDEYIIDGQHRTEAFLLAGVAEGYVDIRRHYFESMADMGDEFVNLNSQLVRMKPDDILRGLESSSAGLTAIRTACPWVGYDMVRRGDKAPLLSMSIALRCWFGSMPEVPTSSSISSSEAAKRTTEEEGEAVASMLKLCYAAWGRDVEYHRLWGALNLILVSWLYRRLVITQYSPKTPKLTRDMFQKCLTSLSAETNYLEWLHGRNLSERDRAPAYNRIKAVFSARIFSDTGKKPMLPTPAWVHA